MKRALPLVLVFCLANNAQALDFNLTWKPYEQPSTHNIVVYCGVNGSTPTPLATVPGTATVARVSLAAAPGNIVRCYLRALRKLDLVYSSASGTVAYTVPAAVTAGNSPPGISGIPAARVAVGNAYQFVPAASDADGDILTYSIHNRPAWAFFSTVTGELWSARKFTFDGWVQQPDVDDIGVTRGIVISVSDGKTTTSLPPFNIEVVAIGAATTPEPTTDDGPSITISPTSPTQTTSTNSPPVISGIPPTRISVGSVYQFAPTAADPDGDTLTFSILNRPQWAFFNTSTGELWSARKFTFDGWVQRPDAGDVGVTNGIVISVGDGTTTRSLPPFNITVTQ